MPELKPKNPAYEGPIVRAKDEGEGACPECWTKPVSPDNCPTCHGNFAMSFFCPVCDNDCGCVAAR